MSHRAECIFLLVRASLVACALGMVSLTELPRMVLAVLGLVGCSVVAPDFLPAGRRKRAWKLAAFTGWGCSFVVFFCLFRAAERLVLWDAYYALVVCLIATAMVFVVRPAMTCNMGGSFKGLAILWGCLGEFILMTDAYLHNRTGLFYFGIVCGVALLVLLKVWLRMPAPIILIVNTLILVLVFTPLVDLAIRPGTADVEDPNANVAGDGYLYSVARTNSRAYGQYWRRYLAQYDRLMRDLFVRDPEQVLPYRVRTNSETTFFQSHVRINSLGFRGKEVPRHKGRSYRIVVLGESNTFGFTLNPEHQPWPELLEEMINARLIPPRPVEVINAGLPHHSLENNLYRLRKDILSLEPNLIVSYHGWNGFPWLYSSLPPVFVQHLPYYHARPLRLLADAEYNGRLLLFKRSLRASPVVKMPSMDELTRGRYGRAYRELVQIAQANNIRLVLANYSMAVNANSDPEVVEFYRQVFPATYPSIQVNVMHSMLVAELVRRNPEICFVDTQPRLDGEHDKFIDLVHFAPEGDRQLAETFLQGITNLLQREWMASSPEQITTMQ